MRPVSLKNLFIAVAVVLPLSVAATPANATSYSLTESTLTGYQYKSVVFGSNKWLTVGGGYEVDVSTNGTSWSNATTISVPPGTMTGISPTVTFGGSAGNEIFVVGGWSTSQTSNPWELDPTNMVDSINGVVIPNLIHTSSDGVIWTSRPIIFSSSTLTAVTRRAAAIRLNDITYGAGRFVAVGWLYDDALTGSATHRSIVVTSTNGTTWTEASLTTVGFVGGATEGLDGVHFGGPTGSELFVAVGWKELFTSPDGITWTARNTATSDVAYGYWREATYGGGKFVVVGDDGYSMTSTNGSTWVFAEIDTGPSGPTQDDIYTVAYSAPDFFIGTDSGILSQSDPTSTTWVNQGSFSSVTGSGVYNNRVVFVRGSMFSIGRAVTTTTSGGGGSGSGSGGSGGGGGSSSGGGTPAPVTTAAPATTTTVPKPSILEPGQFNVTVNGAIVNATVTTLPDGRVQVSGPGFSVTFGGATGGNGNEVFLAQGGSLSISGTGYQPDTRIDVVFANNNKSLGSASTNSNGSFSAQLPVSASTSEGEYEVRASGAGSDGAKRVISIGVSVGKANRLTVAEFAGFSSALTPSLRDQVREILANNPKASAAKCRGFVKVSDLANREDAKLARQRAATVCTYMKSLRPSMHTSITRASATEARRRVEVTIRD